MTKIHTPIDLPHGWHMMYLVKDEAEALRIANGQPAYLYESHIIEALYLFIPVSES